MNFKVLLNTFALVFVAELGDKTQLATLVLAAQSRSPLSVFVGAALALVATTLLGVVLGSAVSHVMPLKYIRMGAGALFLVFGVLLLVGRG